MFSGAKFNHARLEASWQSAANVNRIIIFLPSIFNILITDFVNTSLQAISITSGFYIIYKLSEFASEH